MLSLARHGALAMTVHAACVDAAVERVKLAELTTRILTGRLPSGRAFCVLSAAR